MPITDFEAGSTPSAADFNRYPMQQVHVVKDSNTSRNNTTTLTIDPELQIAVAANTNYWMQCFIIYDGATGGDLRLGFDAPTGTGMEWVSDSIEQSAASSTGDISRSHQGMTNTPDVGSVGVGTKVACVPKGIVRVGSSSGIFSFRWAQAASVATSTTIYSGSVMMLRRLTT